MTSDGRGADRGSRGRGQIGDAKKGSDVQAQLVRLLGESDDIKSKEYSTILPVLIY